MKLLRFLSPVVFAFALASAAEVIEPEFDVLVRVPLDGGLAATGPGGSVLKAEAGGGLNFVEGKAGQAASFGDGQFVEYTLPAALKLDAGTLEFWLLPDYDRHDLADHPMIRLASGDGKGGLDVFFDRNKCAIMAVMKRGDEKTVLSTGRFNPRKWNHVAVTWRSGARATFRLYVDGRMWGVAESFTAPDRKSVV